MKDEIDKAIACLKPPTAKFTFTKSSWRFDELGGNLDNEPEHAPYDGLDELFKLVESNHSKTFNKSTKKFEIDTSTTYTKVEQDIIQVALNALQSCIQVKEPKRTKIYKWLKEMKYNGKNIHGQKFIDNCWSVFKYWANNKSELSNKESLASKRLYAMAKFIKERYDGESSKET